MPQFLCRLTMVLGCLATSALLSAAAPSEQPDGNRLTYLDESSPFYPNLSLARLTTPQWVGEPGVDAVVILAIDDLRQPEKHELMLRPILERLKRIDGHAPVSIMCNGLDPAHPHLRDWLGEGVSLEVHTLAHPCPFLAKSNFVAAADTYQRCVELLNQVNGNRSVAFRMPCCDSINSPSPRFYAEIFNQTNRLGQFLTIDSSVMNILTAADPALKREWVVDADGREKFRKYLPFPSFVTTIENYPYPYVIGKLCWELPAMVPSDWEAQHIHGTNNPVTVADWKAALDATVRKQGVFSFIFHPHGWIRSDQMVEFIDYAVQQYGKRVRFLSFPEVQERLNKNLLGGQPLRAANGQDNGVRLLDVNNDGFMDVVIANENLRRTRLWLPRENRWAESSFPVAAVTVGQGGRRMDAGVRFGIIDTDGNATALVNGQARGAWHFNGQGWVDAKSLLLGLDLDGQPVLTSRGQHDGGVRLRDLDQDGRDELIVGNEAQNAVFAWSPDEESWRKLSYSLPPGAAIVNTQGEDAGLRFVDVNEDGYADVIFSDPNRYSLHLFVPRPFLGFQAGWSREVLSGKRGEAGEIPMIARGGAHNDNGAWFHSRQMWVQNEETASLPDAVDRRSFEELLGGLQPQAKSPEESLASFRVRPGFRIELVASEPLVKDPIAFEWGADGKLWVVEMSDYPLGLDGHGKPGGIVRFLEDTDGDGRYDKSTVFLEGVNFPTGVMPWGKGVIVSAAPEIFYAEDQDGDGRADLRVSLVKGFREGNQQHRLNGFDYGLDNWLYGANGDSGGQVHAIAALAGQQGHHPVNGPVLELRGHDFRFQPDRGLFETVSGQTQYGRHRDDWGNWFGNNNSVWLWHVFLPEIYLERNSHLPVKTVRQSLANYDDGTRVFAASRSMQRFNDIGMLNHVTSANSPMPYRDDLFGPDFATSVFISEPVHNVVHREVLEPDGVTFSSHRAPDEQDREFLASTDNWFRPTMLKTGPDGALYIADMYRLVLEHPEWIPPDTQKSLDLRKGHDKGRIYRVLPVGAQLRPGPRLAGAPLSRLAASLESPNGWTRDTAQRLILSSGDSAVVPELERVAQTAKAPKGRIQALCTLDGLNKLTPILLTRALGDHDPAVREHAVRLSEPFLRASGTGAAEKSREGAQDELKQRLLALVDDPAVRVRFQLAFTLGEWSDPRAASALVQLSARDTTVAPLQTAVLSSALPHVKGMIDTTLNEYRGRVPLGLLSELLNLAVVVGRDDALKEGLNAISQKKGSQFEPWQLGAAAGFLDGVERQQGSLAGFKDQAQGELAQAVDQVQRLIVESRQIALEPSDAEEERVLATALVGRGQTRDEQDLAALAALLRPQVPSPIQRAALANLRRWRDRHVAELLLSGWRGYEPSVRAELLNVLLSRAEWSERLLDAIEKGNVPANQLSPPDRQKLLGSSQASNRARAQALFAVTTNRRELLREYAPVLERNGDQAKGAALFRQNCATCHRLHGEGTNVGPDLGALASKSRETLLIAILDPNQAVESRYASYTALTSADREVSGIVVAETPSSVTLRSAGGSEETILRSDLREFTSSGMSLMPEGFEKVMNRDDLSDLIAFLTARD